MRKSELGDNQLEDLLKEMPQIRDHRDPREIYQIISVKLNKQKRIQWVWPTVAAAAVILLLFVLSPNLLNIKQSASDQVAEKSQDKSENLKTASTKETEDQQQTAAKQEDTSIVIDEQKDEAVTEEKVALKAAVDEEEPTLTAIYEEDLGNKEVLTYQIPDQNAQNIVPVNVLVSNEEGKSQFDIFEATMPRLTEEEWGLSDFYPLNAKLTLDAEHSVLKINVPSDHLYGDGSASELAFIKGIESTLSSLNIEKATLFTDGNPGISFGNSGDLEELSAVSEEKRAYYFYYPGDSSKPFMIPSKESYETIQEALAQMKNNIDRDHLKASIPADVQFEKIEESDGVLDLGLSDDSKLENDESTIHTIEAILLTAKDFHFDAVKIENSKLEQIGKFNLEENLKVPVAPNKEIITE